MIQDEQPLPNQAAAEVERPKVTITVNGDQYKIERGVETVVAIKQVAHLPIAYDLEEIIDGVLKPLPDDGSVSIKGAEVFVSHPKHAGSS